MKDKILVTGGAGYIGSHTVVELYKNNFEVVIYDNFNNSSIEVIKRLEYITKCKIDYINGDIRDKDTLEKVFRDNNITSVIHFAGLKAVGDSVSNPLEYYDNNVHGTLVLLDVMKKYNCKNIIFSSSATVYGSPDNVPILENSPLRCTNPYGRTKLFIEEILRDIEISDNFKIIILRYFNPGGAHESGLIGEDPSGVPNNIMPFVTQVAVGKRDYLSIFGDDYDTIDGTGVRDYIHITDLANGHVKALKILDKITNSVAINLGSGRGYSVLELVKSFEKASGKTIKYEIKDRRAGDIAECFADCSYAKEILNWEAEKDIMDICKDAWKWQNNNPNGYN